MVKKASAKKNSQNKKSPSKKKDSSLIIKFLRVLSLFFGGVVLVTVLQVFVMRWIPPLYTPIMLIDKMNRIWDGEKETKINYSWKNNKNLSPYISLAVIAAEDQKFPEHFGFDLAAIEKAMISNKKGKKIRGASTLTQQVAKNLFLWPGRSFLRKGLEAYYTVLIELLWDKERILEMYVNIAEMGPGVFGAEAASQIYFKKPALKLSRYEASLLAAVLPNPKKFSVRRPSTYVIKRRNWVSRQIVQLGGLKFLEKI